MQRKLANAAVIMAAIGAALLAVQQNTNFLSGDSGSSATERERCYGVAQSGMNDCGTATHACAGRAVGDALLDE